MHSPLSAIHRRLPEPVNFKMVIGSQVVNMADLAFAMMLFIPTYLRKGLIGLC